MTDVRQRRGAHVDEQVLAATLELLSTSGYDFAIEDVAAAASVHKTTIYRRWESKPALVAAAMARMSEQLVVANDTGDAVADLQSLAVQVAVALNTPAGRNTLHATLAAAGSDPQLQGVARTFFHSRYEVAVPIIERAQAAAVLDAGHDPIMLWQAVVNPMHVDAICGIETTPERARALVTLVIDGTRPRGGSGS